MEAYTGDEDLFGKHASDLQTGVSFGEDSVTGTLKYVTDYTGFSSKTAEQQGNYIAFHASTNVEGATITAKITKTSTLDSDGLAVFRVGNKDTQTLTVVASKEGYDTVTKNFALSGLTCESEQVQDVGQGGDGDTDLDVGADDGSGDI